MKHEQRRVCEMIKRTVVQLCQTGFVADSIQIRGVIGVTINNSDVLIIHINEDVTEFDESSVQSCDRSLAESSSTKRHHHIASNGHNSATATHWNEMSGVSAVVRNPEHRSELHNSSSLLPSTSSRGFIKSEENQDERSAMLAKEIDSVDEMFNSDYGREMADPEVPGLCIASIAGSSVACSQTWNDDLVSGKVRQKVGDSAFFPPVCNSIDNQSVHSLDNGELSDTGCLSMNVSDVTFETRGRTDRAFGTPSHRSSLHVTPSPCLSRRSTTNSSGLSGKVSDISPFNENLSTDGHAVESCATKSEPDGQDHDADEESAAVEKPFQCTLCSRRFATASLWKRHSYIHTGEKPFSCPLCSKRFTQSAHLKSHLITHTGEKPYKPFGYQCAQCSRVFATAFLQKRHSYIHTGERPFSCPHCSKRFTQSGHLKAHLSTHTGEKPSKPFACTFCRMKFTRSGNLQRHIVTHTGF